MNNRIYLEGGHADGRTIRRNHTGERFECTTIGLGERLLRVGQGRAVNNTTTYEATGICLEDGTEIYKAVEE